MKQITGWTNGLVMAGVVLAAVVGVGCTGEPKLTVDDATRTYEDGAYDESYRQARSLLRFNGVTGEDAVQANYIAGMSSRHLGEDERAARLLERAAETNDAQLRAEVYAILGLIYSEGENYEAASDRLMRAAPYLSGQDQANAYFYAGVALQKQDRQPEAVTAFRLAREASADPAFQAQVDQRLNYAGYTLQFGAFTDQRNARRAAERAAGLSEGMGLGDPVLVQAVDEQTGGAVTLVQLGLFTDYRSAQQAKRQLGDSGVLIVQRDGS